MQHDSTFVAARIVGPFLAVMGVAMIADSARVLAAISGFLDNDSLLLLIAAIDLGAGLALITLHRSWAGFSAALISLIGWLAILEGALLILAPQWAREIAILFIARPPLVPITGCLVALIGVWLAYAGYISGTLRVEAPRR